MSEYSKRQRVILTINDHEIEAEYQWNALPSTGFAGSVVDIVGVGRFTVPTAALKPVTPPCPWTEVGAIVRRDDGVLFRLDKSGLWEWATSLARANWAEDIAPFNPVRLIPEPPPQPLLKDKNGDLWRFYGTTEHWAGPGGKKVTRGQLEGTWGPLTEVSS